jgi:hypothetical protein
MSEDNSVGYISISISPAYSMNSSISSLLNVVPVMIEMHYAYITLVMRKLPSIEYQVV